ncbi:dihydroxyacetone kinase phosphoryl donor subunit DhaM [Glaciibacter superstes]|uniref:dihydroxyacetone kinase phosphoryl donor subunit DhaM n=1 Tax=Glaciibacter superstes TaxID=501023 RepID=UPI0003B53D0C|nr:dihydroxyacetone kinase phosphoryl donor subunit DhaM [Glaciibacter superstes]
MASERGRVGLVFVSHSTKIAEGLVDLARQMAPSVALVAAGGTDDGGIGTSFEKVSEGIVLAGSGSGVVVLCDLGSAILTADTALDFLDDVLRDRVEVVDAPLVEGGVAAAVAAETGGDLGAVVAAAHSAGPGHPSAGEAAVVDAAVVEPVAGTFSRTVTLVNKDGLHARPAAEFVKLASTFDARVSVNGKDAKSLLGIMSLGLSKGKSAELVSTDPAGERAVNALADLIETGFGEA